MIKSKVKFFLAAISLSFSLPVIAQVTGDNQKFINEYLQRLQRDPHATMDEMPVKMAAIPYQITNTTKFSASDIRSGKFVDIKDSLRLNLLTGSSHALRSVRADENAIIESNNNPANLVDNGNGLIRNVFTMDQKKLSHATLSTQPWSDTYWPLYKGSVSFRYGDPEVTRNAPNTWKDYWIFSNQLRSISYYINNNLTDLLSPAEKYDLLVNNGNYDMTRAGWQMGADYFNSTGNVEKWMGLCHGWAPASYMLPRPKQTITVRSASGRNVKFYPSDIKALGTLLWAETAPPIRFVGGRCNSKNPAKDENGRILDPDCFDVNPGSWHQSVINQIGVANRSFVIDATFDYEVWNQPVVGYNYIYFNPRTGQAFNSAREAVITRAQYTNDKFAKYRDPSAVNIVGVRMTLNYMTETAPTHSDSDNANRDAITSVSYMYDLELDSIGNIIGGEWYTNRHPDFMWTPSPRQRAISSYNPSDSWNPNNLLPAYWSINASNASRNREPLTAVVEQLFNAAAGQ